MATPNASTVLVGSPYDVTGGSVWYGIASEVTAPTNATTDISATFTCLGHLTTDGVELSESIDTNDISAWGNVKLRTTWTNYSETASFSLMQGADADVAAFAYGSGNITLDTDGALLSVGHNGTQTPDYCIVIDMLAAPTIKERLVMPVASITNRESLTFDGENAASRGIELALNPGSDGKTTCFEYFAIIE